MTTILLADDHPLMLSGIGGLLDNTKYQIVACVTDGFTALEEIERTKPYIALLDVNMPQMGGIEVLAHLRVHDSATKIVLLTADLSDDNLLAAMELSVEGILLKNGGERLLIECLDKVSSGGHWIPQEMLIRSTEVRRARAEDPIYSLNPRERDLCQLVAQGLRNRSIANELNLSEGTVKVYLNRIYEKLGVSSRTELVKALGDSSAGRE